MNLDFFLAKQKHIMWTIKLKAFLMDLQEFSVEQAVSHKSCDLGKWIYEYGYEAYKNYPEMVELELIHIDLHKSVKGIIEYKNSGKSHLAVEEFNKLQQISDKIVTLLNVLEGITNSNEK